MKKICLILSILLVLCSSVFAEITPTSTSNSGSVYTKDGNIRIGSMKDKDKTAKELEEEAKKAKTEQPKINAIQNMFDMKGKIAHDRLKVVLIHDRANISPEVMDNLKNDIIKVISNYMEINQKDMEISLANDDDSVALVANIPVNNMKHDKG